MGYKVAVVGATGNVGREMLDILAERAFPADEVVALASRRSQGRERKPPVRRRGRSRRGASRPFRSSASSRIVPVAFEQSIGSIRQSPFSDALPSAHFRTVT